MEADFAFGLGRWRHEFADGVEQRLDGVIVALQTAFQFGQLAGQDFVARQHPTEAHESAHDGDVDLHSTVAPQHAGKHRHPLLSEGVGQSPPQPAPT